MVFGNRSTEGSSSRAKRVGGIGAVVLGLIGITAACNGAHLDRDTYVGRVTDKQVKRKDDTDKYLVFTKLEDGSVRVFQNTDSPLEWKFNSSDIQGELEVGKTYALRTYGWRIPFFSKYENLVSVTEVPNSTSPATLPR